MNKSITPIVIIASVVISFTISSFFLLRIDVIAINILALLFLLLSEILLFVGVAYIHIIKKECHFYLKVGISVTLFLYFATTFASAVLAIIFIERLNYFILIQLAIISFHLVVIVLISVFSANISRQNIEDISKIDTNVPKRGGF